MDDLELVRQPSGGAEPEAGSSKGKSNNHCQQQQQAELRSASQTKRSLEGVDVDASQRRLRLDLDQQSANKAAPASKQTGGRPEASEKSTSSDEGLGSGSSSSGQSSAQSSTAGSHCDDRETPPHLAPLEAGPGSPSRPAGPREPAQQNYSYSCDNLKLSVDSLDFAAAGPLPAGQAKEASGAQKARNKSHRGPRGRTLTWSASLGSLGASFRSSFGAKATRCRSAEGEAEEEEDEEGQMKGRSVLFHASCFSCATCAELLVDLRALIYVTDLAAPGHRSGKGRLETAPAGEYVNLAGEEAQISLYCHRHFVELFKPRCQQCDCLILDEECTEAEGKSPRRRLDGRPRPLAAGRIQLSAMKYARQRLIDGRAHAGAGWPDRPPEAPPPPRASKVESRESSPREPAARPPRRISILRPPLRVGAPQIAARPTTGRPLQIGRPAARVLGLKL